MRHLEMFPVSDSLCDAIDYDEGAEVWERRLGDVQFHWGILDSRTGCFIDIEETG